MIKATIFKYKFTMNTETNQHSKNKITPGFFLCLGVSVGACLGVLFKNVAIGLGLGVSVGAMLEAIYTDKKKQK